MKRYDLDQGNDYHPAATMLAEIARLEDHLHGCREQREAAEALESKAQIEIVRLKAEFVLAHKEVLQVDIRLKQEVERLRAVMEDAARILLDCEERPTPNAKLIHDAWVTLRTGLGYKS